MDSREINKIVVHCTDSPDDRDVGFKEIDQWHQERGFDGVLVGIDSHRVYCGYHYVIRRDGTVETGRPDHYIGAHVKGHNKNSIGVVWVGKDKISTDQVDALLVLLHRLMLKYNLDVDCIYGHGELFEGKTCPNLNMDSIRDALCSPNNKVES